MFLSFWLPKHMVDALFWISGDRIHSSLLLPLQSSHALYQEEEGDCIVKSPRRSANELMENNKESRMRRVRKKVKEDGRL